MLKLYVITVFVCFIGIIIFDFRLSESVKLRGYKSKIKRNFVLNLLSTTFMFLFLSIIPFFNFYFLAQFMFYDENVMIRKLLDEGEIYYEGDF